MQNIKSLREGQGLSRQELSDKSGLSLAVIHKVETKPTCRVNVETAELLSQALNVQVRDIFHPYQLSQQGRPPRTGCKLNRRQEVATRICPSCHLSTNAYLDACGHCEAVLQAV